MFEKCAHHTHSSVAWSTKNARSTWADKELRHWSSGWIMIHCRIHEAMEQLGTMERPALTPEETVLSHVMRLRARYIARHANDGPRETLSRCLVLDALVLHVLIAFVDVQDRTHCFLRVLCRLCCHHQPADPHLGRLDRSSTRAARSQPRL